MNKTPKKKEAKAPKENPLEKLSIEEIEKVVVDASQRAKEKEQELKNVPEYISICERIAEHKKSDKIKDLKEKIADQKEKVKALNEEMNEDIQDLLEQKSEIAKPYTEVIGFSKKEVKDGIAALQKKGRVVS